MTDDRAAATTATATGAATIEQVARLIFDEVHGDGWDSPYAMNQRAFCRDAARAVIRWAAAQDTATLAAAAQVAQEQANG